MTFKQGRRKVQNTFAAETDLGFDRLIVSGCSFTFNGYDVPTTWPYFLRDIAGFDEVLDSSLPGAGNYHIANALRWSLDTDQIDPDEKTLVIVMWSDTSRVDSIVNSQHLDSPNITQYRWYGKDDSDAVTAFSGGRQQWFWTNLRWHWFRDFHNIKTDKTMAVENYLNVVGLAEWLEARGFDFLFTNFVDYDLPSRCSTFDPTAYLPKHLADKYRSYFDNKLQTIYSYCVKHDLLTDDDFHPSPEGQKQWCKNVLLPYLINKYRS